MKDQDKWILLSIIDTLMCIFAPPEDDLWMFPPPPPPDRYYDDGYREYDEDPSLHEPQFENEPPDYWIGG